MATASHLLFRFMETLSFVERDHNADGGSWQGKGVRREKRRLRTRGRDIP